MIESPSYWYCACDWNLKKDGESCDCKYEKKNEESWKKNFVI